MMKNKITGLKEEYIDPTIEGEMNQMMEEMMIDEDNAGRTIKNRQNTKEIGSKVYCKIMSRDCSR